MGVPTGEIAAIAHSSVPALQQTYCLILECIYIIGRFAFTFHSESIAAVFSFCCLPSDKTMRLHFICSFGYIFHNFQTVSQWFWCALGWCAFLGFKWPPPFRVYMYICTLLSETLSSDCERHSNDMKYIIVSLYVYNYISRLKIVWYECPTSIFGCHAWNKSRLTDFR